MTNSDDYHISGVEKQLVEQFIILFKDHYRKTDEAAFFLEQREGESNVYGIANTRDALSHFVSAFNPELTPDQRKGHLSNAEEHLRRAIVEPYERAIAHRVKLFKPLREKYKKEVLPRKRSYAQLVDAPDVKAINLRLKEINRLMINGRSIKGKNISDPLWEAGIKDLIDSYEKLLELYENLEEYCVAAHESNQGSKGQIYAFLSVALGVITIILSVILALVVSN